MIKLLKLLRHNELLLQQELGLRQQQLQYNWQGDKQTILSDMPDYCRQLGTNDRPLTSYCHRLTAESTKHISSFRSAKTVHKYAPKLFSLKQLQAYINVYCVCNAIHHTWICMFINGLAKYFHKHKFSFLLHFLDLRLLCFSTVLSFHCLHNFFSKYSHTHTHTQTLTQFSIFVCVCV